METNFQRTNIVPISIPIVSLFSSFGVALRISEDSIGVANPLGLTRLRAASDPEARTQIAVTIVADFIMVNDSRGEL